MRCWRRCAGMAMPGADPDRQWEGVHRPVRAGRLEQGGDVRPDLRREWDPASADRAAVPDHDREGGAAAQDDACRVPHRATIIGTPPWRSCRRRWTLGCGVQHRPAASGVGDAAPDRAVPAGRRTSAGEAPWSSRSPSRRSPAVEPRHDRGCLGCSGGWTERGLISLAGFRYRVPIVLAGEPVEAVVAEHLVRIFHRDVLVAEHVQRRKPDTGDKPSGSAAAGPPAARQATSGPTVTRVADNSGSVSFAGTSYRVGNAWRSRSVQVSIVASSVQLSCDGQIVRVHPIRHDRVKEHGAFATPNGRPRHRQDAPAGADVKATPLRGRPAGRALTPTPHTGAVGSGAEPPDPHDDVDHVKQVPELIRQAGTGT